MNKKVVIVQEKIPEYRVPLFEGLENKCDLDILVLHSQNKDFKCSFSTVFVKKFSFLKLNFQMGLLKYCRDADIVILMFDLRWISNVALALICRKKVLLWGHGYGRSVIGNHVRTFLAKFTGALIVYEESDVSKFIECGIKREKVFYSGNTVYVDNPGINDKNKKTQFLYVGRLQSRKRIDLLLEAFAKIKNKLPSDCGVTILGDGEIKSQLTKCAIDLRIADRVKFIGATFDSVELKSIYHTALAYVSPGHVGLGVLHSFAYGVPVVTNANADHAPEVSNIKHAENGVFVNDGNELSLELAKLANDDEYQMSLSSSAYRHYINSRSMAHLVDRFAHAIDHLSSHKSG